MVALFPFTVPWWTSKRVGLSVICFFGFFFLYAQRVNLSVAIVCMVQSEASSQTDINNFDLNTESNFRLTNDSIDDNRTRYIAGRDEYTDLSNELNRNTPKNISLDIVTPIKCPTVGSNHHKKVIQIISVQ